MLADDDAKRESAKEALVNYYREAFRGRSTYAERSSTVDHLQDLSEVLPDGDDRKPYLAAALNELRPWSNTFAPATSADRRAGDRPLRGPGGSDGG
jgi:hypothetical protein